MEITSETGVSRLAGKPLLASSLPPKAVCTTDGLVSGLVAPLGIGSSSSITPGPMKVSGCGRARGRADLSRQRSVSLARSACSPPALLDSKPGGHKKWRALLDSLSCGDQRRVLRASASGEALSCSLFAEGTRQCR